MALDLDKKVARLIRDFHSIAALANTIPHEMERRIIARHAMVKLDALLLLLPRLKNEIKKSGVNTGGNISALEALIRRLGFDYNGQEFETIRDAAAAHSLKLDLERLFKTWTHLGPTLIQVIQARLDEIEVELKAVTSGSYVSEGAIPPATNLVAEITDILGDPKRPRIATIYPGIAIAGISGPLPGGHPLQDSLIRVVGLATFLRQVQAMLGAASLLPAHRQLLMEIFVNDYMAMRELLFASNVQNAYGPTDVSFLKQCDAFDPSIASQIRKIEENPPATLSILIKVRNTITAHLDPDIPFDDLDISRWAVTEGVIIDDCHKTIMAIWAAVSSEITLKALFVPPTPLPPHLTGVASQEGRRWDDA